AAHQQLPEDLPGPRDIPAQKRAHVTYAFPQLLPQSPVVQAENIAPGALQGLQFGDQLRPSGPSQPSGGPQLVSRLGAGRERVQTALEPGLDLSQLALEVSAAIRRRH